ncbi:hypothetical protein SDC9_48991 [bioreactor metagenome]|uniref:Uncharacterized protein n=1 Tax=bioreactor metagenome TaxID=1076179 RepID=A0A644WFV5_9ZZZZ
MRNNSLTFGGSQHNISEPEQTAGGNRKFKPGAVSAIFNIGNITLSLSNNIDHLTTEIRFDIDSQPFNRLAFHTVNFLDNNFGLTYLQFITFATHGFDQNTQVKHTTSVNQP